VVVALSPLDASVLVALTVRVKSTSLFAGGVNAWHVGHVLDPFFTLATFDGSRRNSDDVLVGLGVFAVTLLALQLPGVVRAFGEVLALRRAPARSGRAD